MPRLLVNLGAAPGFHAFKVEPALARMALEGLHVHNMKREIKRYGNVQHEIPFTLALRSRLYEEAIAMLPVGFLSAPGMCLYAGLCVSEALQAEAQTVRVTDPAKAARNCALS